VQSGIRTDPAEWSDERHKRGLEGEGFAIEHLRTQGWIIEAHRFRLGRLEIDLVARRGNQVAFVEVKTRRGSAFGSPLEAVTGAKKRELVRVARGWMDRHGRPPYVYRFDVIAVTLSKQDRPLIQHVEDAFRPGWR
jgi:putative endonuclease